MDAFMLQQQRRIAVTEFVRLIKPKIFIISPCIGNLTVPAAEKLGTYYGASVAQTHNFILRP